MIGSATGRAIGITGLGTNVPAKVMTNDDLAAFVDTSDEWIQERTGIKERRIADAGGGAERHRAAGRARGARRGGRRRRPRSTCHLRDGDP